MSNIDVTSPSRSRARTDINFPPSADENPLSANRIILNGAAEAKMFCVRRPLAAQPIPADPRPIPGLESTTPLRRRVSRQEKHTHNGQRDRFDHFEADLGVVATRSRRRRPLGSPRVPLRSQVSQTEIGLDERIQSVDSN